MIKPN